MAGESLDVQMFAMRDRGTLVFQGDLDASTAPRFEREVLRLVDAGLRSICVDLTNVELVDSTGLGTLIGAHQAAQRSGARFDLRPSEQISRLLQRAGLLGYFGLASID